MDMDGQRVLGNAWNACGWWPLVEVVVVGVGRTFAWTEHCCGVNE